MNTPNTPPESAFTNCPHCGRDYSPEKFKICPSDDCPSNEQIDWRALLESHHPDVRRFFQHWRRLPHSRDEIESWLDRQPAPFMYGGDYADAF